MIDDIRISLCVLCRYVYFRYNTAGTDDLVFCYATFVFLFLCKFLQTAHVPTYTQNSGDFQENEKKSVFCFIQELTKYFIYAYILSKAYFIDVLQQQSTRYTTNK